MDVYVYTATYRASDGERECVRRLENAGRRALLRNGQFFERVVSAEAVYSDVERIRRAYERKGIPAYRIGEPTGTMYATAPPEVEEPEHIVTHEVKGAWAYVYVNGEKVETVRKAQIREALKRWEHT